MISFVNAKINLGLRVVERLSSGYHRLDTIFYPVGLYNGTPLCPYPLNDILEVTKAHSYFLEQLGDKATINSEDNIVSRAYRAFTELLTLKNIPPQAFHVRLEKHLPTQAGMGGGSADCAFALNMFNKLSGTPLSDFELHKLATFLGADCPFFLKNTPAHGAGIGDILSPLPERLKGKWCAIVKGNENISTKEAFAGIQPSGEDGQLKEVYTGDIKHWPDKMINDFEGPFFKAYPHCRIIKERFYSCGALYASLSGSGGAFFGIFDFKEEAYTALKHQQTPFKALALL